jgi:hypothetical protein
VIGTPVNVGRMAEGEQIFQNFIFENRNIKKKVFENRICKFGIRCFFQLFVKFIFLTTYSLLFNSLLHSAEKFVRSWSEK